MKTIVPSSNLWGKTIRRPKIVLIFILLILGGTSSAQCPGGYNQAQINWDRLDFMPSNVAAYTGFYLNTSVPYTQSFAIGKARMSFSFDNQASVALSGENNTNTAHTGSFSTAGDDVAISTSTSAARTMTFTFDQDVANVQFSLFDVDALQVFAFTAANAASVAQNITATKANAGSSMVIVGSGTTAVTVTGTLAGVANNDNNGTLNISIAGPVRTISITMSSVAGDFWLGDIDACVTGSFPTNYFAGLQPFTGQPTYIIGTSDTNTVSLINVATGQAVMIFQDASSPRYINGLGYDHINHELYYVIDFTSTPSSNRELKRYNFDTQVISTVLADIRSIGITTFQRGVESAGCAWYDGALYFGIEGNGSASRENVVWRIDFDASRNPISATQIYAKGSSAHDWGDFVLFDGMFYDMNSGAGSPEYAHYNLQTGQLINSYTGVSPQPRQTGITWNNTVYWVYDSLALYNMNGTIGARTDISGPTVLDWTGFCGDATGFRPKSDFGDAPATYDPVALSPALHMLDTFLRLGPSFDQEFNKMGTGPLADADGSDEDGIATVNVLDTATTNYLASVRVWNNTGANATLIGWLDINGNGTFEAVEGRTLTVPHGGAVLQNVTLSWLGINTPLLSGQWTYMRIRLTSAANSMTTADATGYFSNGEVEDYLVWTVNTLPVNLTKFTAQAVNNSSVKISWTTDNESNMNGYEIQRSANSYSWETIGTVAARNLTGQQDYIHIDNDPLQGKSYYRLKMMERNTTSKFSQVEAVMIKVDQVMVVVYPNPVDETSVMRIISEQYLDATVKIYSSTGAELSSKKLMINPGENKIPLDTGKLPAGVYSIKVETPMDVKTAKFVKK